MTFLSIRDTLLNMKLNYLGSSVTEVTEVRDVGKKQEEEIFEDTKELIVFPLQDWREKPSFSRPWLSWGVGAAVASAILGLAIIILARYGWRFFA